MAIRLDLGWILAAGFGLILFGIGYNSLVAELERRKLSEGYSAILVAGGVIVTLAVVAAFDWIGALLALGAFACSGMPMIVGSIARHVTAKEQESLREP
jgi:Kef-type K+ transport system membrane component KefB